MNEILKAAAVGGLLAYLAYKVSQAWKSAKQANAEPLTVSNEPLGEIKSTPGGAAAACLRALKDADAAFPGRSKASDGIMGDKAHQARVSDHNDGNAFDVTHDPAHGCDGQVIADAALTDPRTKYVIWNKQIRNVAKGDTAWRPYDGANPHTHHCHVSIRPESRDDDRHWPWYTPGAGNT